MKTKLFFLAGLMLITLGSFSTLKAHTTTYFGNLEYYYTYQDKIDRAYFSYYLDQFERQTLIQQLRDIRRYEVRALRDHFLSYHERANLRNLQRRFERNFNRSLYYGYYNSGFGYNSFQNNGYYYGNNNGYGNNYEGHSNNGYYNQNGNYHNNDNDYSYSTQNHHGNYGNNGYYGRRGAEPKTKAKGNSSHKVENKTNLPSKRQVPNIDEKNIEKEISNIEKTFKTKSSSDRKIEKDSFNWEEGK